MSWVQISIFFDIITLFIFLAQFFVEPKFFRHDKKFVEDFGPDEKFLASTKNFGLDENFSLNFRRDENFIFNFCLDKILFSIFVATKISFSIFVATKISFSIFIARKISLTVPDFFVSTILAVLMATER